MMSMSKEQQEQNPIMATIRFAEELERKKAEKTECYTYEDQSWQKRQAQIRAQRYLDDPQYDYLTDKQRLRQAILERNKDPNLFFPSPFWKRVPAYDAYVNKHGVLMQIIQKREKGIICSKVIPYDEYKKNLEKKGRQAKIAAKGVEYKPTVVKNPETLHMSQKEKEKFLEEEQKRKEKASKKKQKVKNSVYQSIASGIEQDPKDSKKSRQKEARTASSVKRENQPKKMKQERQFAPSNIKKEIIEPSSLNVKKEEKNSIKPSRYKTSVKIEFQNPQESANTKPEEYTFTPSRNRMKEKEKEEQEERQAKLSYQNELKAIQNFEYSEDEEEEPKPIIKYPLRKKSEAEQIMENYIDTVEPQQEKSPNNVQEKVIQNPRKENDEKKKQKKTKIKKTDDLVMFFTTKLHNLEEKARERNQLNHPGYQKKRKLFEDSLKAAIQKKRKEKTLTAEQIKKRAEEKKQRIKKKKEQDTSSKNKISLSEQEQIYRQCGERIQEIMRKGDESRQNFQTLMASHGPDNIPTMPKAAYILDVFYGEIKPSKKILNRYRKNASKSSVKNPKYQGVPLKRQNPLTRQSPDHFDKQVKVNKKKHKSPRDHPIAEEQDWRVELRKTTNYNPRDRKYRQRDAQPVIESNFDQILKEDKRSRKIGKHEERNEKADNVEDDYSEEDY